MTSCKNAGCLSPSCLSVSLRSVAVGTSPTTRLSCIHYFLFTESHCWTGTFQTLNFATSAFPPAVIFRPTQHYSYLTLQQPPQHCRACKPQSPQSNVTLVFKNMISSQNFDLWRLSSSLLSRISPLDFSQFAVFQTRRTEDCFYQLHLHFLNKP